VQDCVFCSHEQQPAILFETPSLYAMPDKYPLLPGHVLIINKEHRRCYAQAGAEIDAEIEQATARVRRFLAESYGTASLAWENGVFGQTVFHAHLHLIPVRSDMLPPEIEALPAVSPAADWTSIREHFASAGGYRYLELAGQRRLIAGRGILGPIRDWLAEATGVRHSGRDWLRGTTPEDVAELARRWQEWEGIGC
jgi:diadenosine tetraphosphate (Ap4A) HIT family hydrolase